MWDIGRGQVIMEELVGVGAIVQLASHGDRFLSYRRH